jgi:hypothetical protein
MNTSWLVPTLVASLIVVIASFGAAVTADAVSRHSRVPVREWSTPASPETTPPLHLGVDEVEDVAEKRWSRGAVRAWTVCVAASLISVALIGVLILFA